MKDFDAVREERWSAPEEDRTFMLRGKTMIVQAHPPFPAYFPQAKITNTSSIGTDLTALNELALGLLEPDSRQAWEEVIAQADDPVTAEDLGDVITWMVEASAKRPTGRRTSSRSSRGSSGTSLTVASSAPDANGA